MTLPMILLQKPSASSKAKDHPQALVRRMDGLKIGDFSLLLSECRNIQQQLQPKKSTANFSKAFAKLMFQGKINAALRLLSDKTCRGVLPLSEEVFQSLREKYPSPAEIKSDSLLHDPIADLSNVSVAVDKRGVLEIAKTLKGAAGPSGLHAIISIFECYAQSNFIAKVKSFVNKLSCYLRKSLQNVLILRV